MIVEVNIPEHVLLRLRKLIPGVSDKVAIVLAVEAFVERGEFPDAYSTSGDISSNPVTPILWSGRTS